MLLLFLFYFQTSGDIKGDGDGYRRTVLYSSEGEIGLKRLRLCVEH